MINFFKLNTLFNGLNFIQKSKNTKGSRDRKKRKKNFFWFTQVVLLLDDWKFSWKYWKFETERKKEKKFKKLLNLFFFWNFFQFLNTDFYWNSCFMDCFGYHFVKKLFKLSYRIELIWQDVDKSSNNCWIEMARTRNILLRLTPAEKTALLKKDVKECRVPSVVDALPHKFQKKITDIWEKSVEKVKRQTDCWEQQRKTR